MSDNERIVKVRYLAQGIITIPNGDLPITWDDMSAREKWAWLNWWWEAFVTQEMLNQGIEDCDSDPGEVSPGRLEEFKPGADDYENIAISNEYERWFNMENATAMYQEVV